MKSKIITGLLLLAASSMVKAGVKADFEMPNNEGVELSYRIIKSETPCEVEVVAHDNWEELGVDSLAVPEKVVYDDTEYIVTGVSDNVFAMNTADSDPIELVLPKTFKHFGKLNIVVK